MLHNIKNTNKNTKKKTIIRWYLYSEVASENTPPIRRQNQRRIYIYIYQCHERQGLFASDDVTRCPAPLLRNVEQQYSCKTQFFFPLPTLFPFCLAPRISRQQVVFTPTSGLPTRTCPLFLATREMITNTSPLPPPSPSPPGPPGFPRYSSRQPCASKEAALYLETFTLAADEVVEEVAQHLRDASPEFVHHEGVFDALAHVRQHAEKQLRLLRATHQNRTQKYFRSYINGVASRVACRIEQLPP